MSLDTDTNSAAMQKGVRVEKTLLSVLVLVFAAAIVLIVMANSQPSEFFSAFAWTVPAGILLSVAYLSNGCEGVLRQVFCNAAIVFVGNVSFELFLWHQLIGRYAGAVANKLGFGNQWWIYVLAFIMSLGMALLTQRAANKRKDDTTGKCQLNAP